jgi:intermediate peptidase
MAVENVRAFLDSLLAVSKPRALEAIKYVAVKKKRREMPDSKAFDNLPTLQLWDRDAYFPSQSPAPVIEIRDLTAGLAIAAFSRFLQHAYGMHLEAADVCTGEVWHADVRKVNVLDENGEVVGWIYFDLFNRPGKPGGACHYTVRCSRRVDLDDAEGDFGTDGPREFTPQVEDEFVLSAEAHGSKARGGLHQRPVAVIVCDLFHMGFSEMKWNDVVTLWHELGHAMHCGLDPSTFSISNLLVNLSPSFHDSNDWSHRVWEHCRDTLCD